MRRLNSLGYKLLNALGGRITRSFMKLIGLTIRLNAIFIFQSMSFLGESDYDNEDIGTGSSCHYGQKAVSVYDFRT